MQDRMFLDVPSEIETLQYEIPCRFCGKTGTVYFHNKSILVCGEKLAQHKAQCSSCGGQLACLYVSDLKSEAKSEVASLN
jgi:hypothetical protein